MGVTPADLLQEVKAILTPDQFSDDLFKDINAPPAILDTERLISAAHRCLSFCSTQQAALPAA